MAPERIPWSTARTITSSLAVPAPTEALPTTTENSKAGVTCSDTSAKFRSPAFSRRNRPWPRSGSTQRRATSDGTRSSGKRSNSSPSVQDLLDKAHKLAIDVEVDAHTVDTARRGLARHAAVRDDTVARVVLAFEREQFRGAALKLRLVHVDVRVHEVPPWPAAWLRTERNRRALQRRRAQRHGGHVCDGLVPRIQRRAVVDNRGSCRAPFAGNGRQRDGDCERDASNRDHSSIIRSVEPCRLFA